MKINQRALTLHPLCIALEKLTAFIEKARVKGDFLIISFINLISLFWLILKDVFTGL